MQDKNLDVWSPDQQRHTMELGASVVSCVILARDVIVFALRNHQIKIHMLNSIQ